jgi:hypothetical protein
LSRYLGVNEETNVKEIIMYLAAAMGVILALCRTVIYVIIKYTGKTSPGYTRGAAKAISSTLGLEKNEL